MPTIVFQRLPGNDVLPLPTYATAGAAGFDLRAAASLALRHLYRGMPASDRPGPVDADETVEPHPRFSARLRAHSASRSPIRASVPRGLGT